LSASADFTFGSGTLTVTLTNTLAANNFRSAGQALSDISFTLSNAAGTLGSTSASGQFGNISGTSRHHSSGVTVTYTLADVQTKGHTTTTFLTPTRWLGAQRYGSFSTSSNTIMLETLGGGQPSQMIAPSIANGRTYANGNNGLQQFDAYVIGPATFTLDLSGVTPTTTVTAATFSFGTGPETFLSGVFSSPTPAPPSVVLLGLGGLGLALMLIQSRRRLAAAA
jgi:hypothetical protein